GMTVARRRRAQGNATRRPSVETGRSGWLRLERGEASRHSPTLKDQETEMSKIRINELARELEIKPKVITDYLPEIGVTDKKSHSSALDEDVANKVRERFHSTGEEQGSEPRVTEVRVAGPPRAAPHVAEQAPAGPAAPPSPPAGKPPTTSSAGSAAPLRVGPVPPTRAPAPPTRGWPPSTGVGTKTREAPQARAGAAPEARAPGRAPEPAAAP